MCKVIYFSALYFMRRAIMNVENAGLLLVVLLTSTVFAKQRTVFWFTVGVYTVQILCEGGTLIVMAVSPFKISTRIGVC